VGHWCAECKAYHQVESHGHPEDCDAFRFDVQDGQPRTAADLMHHVKASAMQPNLITLVWFGSQPASLACASECLHAGIHQLRGRATTYIERSSV